MSIPSDTSSRPVRLPLHQPSQASTTPLPPLLARWIEGFLGAALPAESRATCDDCVMCKPVASRLDDEGFHPEARCCTYGPTLPNYSVGLILRGPDGATARGRAEIARRVSSRLGATPLGLEPSRAYTVKYARLGDESFGKVKELCCPYFEPETAGCGIWQHRNAVCGTWFCHHERRALGARFWRHANKFLTQIERDVAAWCLLELGFEARVLAELVSPRGEPHSLAEGGIRGFIDPDGPLDEAAARRLWGSWYGREVELYRACAERVEPLDMARIRAIGGVRLALAERSLVNAHAALSDRTIPRALSLRSVEALTLDGGGVRVATDLTPFDPLVMSEGTFEALASFDGRDTVDAVQAARAQGVEIDDDQLRQWVDHGILVPPDEVDVPIRARATEPVHADTRLCFFRNFQASEVVSKIRSGEGGRQILSIECGTKEIEFDDPELIEFGRKLVEFQNGFRARDTLGWAPPGVTYSWERISPLLQALVDESVLQPL
jgi:hypothetical protein